MEELIEEAKKGNKDAFTNLVIDIENDLYPLVELCTELLSDDPLLFIINSYTY